jgi:penicillin amidase
VISGFNEQVAWGITNASTDVKDWYTVTFKDKSKSQYLMDSAWKPVRKLIEVFRVRGGDLVFDTIRFTEHGPVAYEESFNKRSETVNMALRWTAHDISNEMLAIYQLNKAENHADYIAATNHFDCPGQNFVFAATNGDIAIRHNGKFVKRWNQQGRFLLDGTSSSTLWQGFVPDSDNPHVLNPPQGFVSSANQHPTDQTYPYYYTGSYDYYRNRRLNRLLKDLREAKPADMMKIQNDNYNLYASEWLPYFVTLMPETQFSTSEKDAMRELKGWTFFNDPDVSAAIYFQLWIDSFMSKLWDEFKVDQRALLTPSYFETWSYLKRFPDSDFIDNKSTTQTETLPFLILQSFREAVKTADKWQLENPSKQFTWANFKNTTVLHLSQQLAFSVSEIQTGGNEDILNATSSRKGASWRMVVSPGSDGEIWGVYPGGQSGNPGSKHYVDFIEQWAKGKYFQLLLLQPGEKHKRIQHVATYNP